MLELLNQMDGFQPNSQIKVTSLSYSTRKGRDRIGGAMVSVVAMSAVDRGFEQQSGQTKDYKNCILR